MPLKSIAATITPAARCALEVRVLGAQCTTTVGAFGEHGEAVRALDHGDGLIDDCGSDF
jgi:hypothetical protein